MAAPAFSQFRRTTYDDARTSCLATIALVVLPALSSVACRPQTRFLRGTTRAPNRPSSPLSRRVTKEGRRISFRLPSASRCSTTTARCGPSSRCISRLFFIFDRIKTLAPQHPGVEEQGALRLGAQRRHESRAGRRRESDFSRWPWPRTRA